MMHTLAMHNTTYRCSGDGPGYTVECAFSTNSARAASDHWEATGHAVDQLPAPFKPARYFYPDGASEWTSNDGEYRLSRYSASAYRLWRNDSNRYLGQYRTIADATVAARRDYITPVVDA